MTQINTKRIGRRKPRIARTNFNARAFAELGSTLFETSAKRAEQAIGTPSIARQVVEKAAALCRAMLGVPVLQKSLFVFICVHSWFESPA
jgi:hypothetical protein